MAKQKIINDPIYGLISFPFDIIYDIIDDPIFQRLRRISQLGLTSYVYPGAVHTRFHHTLGVVHLCDRLINTLMKKGVEISKEEHEAICLVALLHDIGHGPLSHTLEFELVATPHEEITIEIIKLLNQSYSGGLELALSIFTNQYHRRFLFQIISGQIDVDRMDYLNRDSYYTGVAEGVIGYDRLIAMMNVQDDQLVVEEKGIFSIEKFLLSRYLMYRQVYLHKTSISAEQMLRALIRYYKSVRSELPSTNRHTPIDRVLDLSGITNTNDLNHFIQIDDSDVIQLLKKLRVSHDVVLQTYASSLLDRKLFKTELSYESFSKSKIDYLSHKNEKLMNLDKKTSKNFVILGNEKISFYKKENEIGVLTKQKKSIVPLSSLTIFDSFKTPASIFFITSPK